MVEISLAEIDDVAIVSIKKSVSLVSLVTHHNSIFAGQIFQKTKRNKIILEMENVIKIDSAGIAEIIKVYRKLKHNDGTLAPTGMNSDISRSIRSAGLDKVLNI